MVELAATPVGRGATRWLWRTDALPGSVHYPPRDMSSPLFSRLLLPVRDVAAPRYAPAFPFNMPIRHRLRNRIETYLPWRNDTGDNALPANRYSVTCL